MGNTLRENDVVYQAPEGPLSENVGRGKGSSAWTFLTNHSHVLICLAHDPLMRLRDVADRVGITERAVQRIVADLERGGVIRRVRQGRRNQYEVEPTCPLRHPVESHRTVADILRLGEEL